MSDLKKICSVDECLKGVCARGLCQMHYWRLMRHGSVHHSRIKRAFRRGNSPNETFRAYVTISDTDDCIAWGGTRQSSGYGEFSCLGIKYLAHRFSYSLHNGEIPDGMFVRHTCDNPPCVNPRHLLMGPPALNVQDMVSRDRHSRGERNGHAKLTRDDVTGILQMLSTGMPQRGIAEKYGVTPQTITDIKKGRSWNHLSRSKLPIQSSESLTK